HLEEPRELRLVRRRIDHGVLVVVEEAEMAVEADIDARGLDEGRVEGVQTHPVGGDLSTDVTVGEEAHPANVPRSLPGRPYITECNPSTSPAPRISNSSPPCSTVALDYARARWCLPLSARGCREDLADCAVVCHIRSEEHTSELQSRFDL